MIAVARQRQRGATVVVVAIVLVVLLGFLGLALDSGHLFSVRGELQNGADAAALAGVQDLNGKPGPPLDAAVANAQDFAARHRTDSQHAIEVFPGQGDVEVGYWDRGTHVFTAIPRDHPDIADLATCATLPCVNAVRVRTFRDAGHVKPVSVFLGGILGTSTATVGASACAVTGGPCVVECADLPIVLPDCGIKPLVGPPCAGGTYKVKFATDTTDSGAWSTLLDEAGGGASLIKCLLETTRDNSGKCSSDPNCKLPAKTTDVSLEAGEPVWVSNGKITSACELIVQLYKDHPQYKYLVPVASASCPNQKWNQTVSIVSFATIKIEWAPDSCTGQGNQGHFLVRVLCDQSTEHATEGGCTAQAGTWVETPRLVPFTEAGL